MKNISKIFLLFFFSVPIFAQADAYLKITDFASSMIRVAVLNFVPKSKEYPSGTDTVISNLTKVLREDLKFSPFIEVVDTLLYPRMTIKDSKEINPFEWSSPKVQAIVLGEFDRDSKRISVKITLHSVTGSTKIFSKNYSSEHDQSRRLMHRIADDIHKALTGEEGVAQTQIAFITTRYNGTKELCVCDYDGYAPRRITDAKSIVLSPDWSPGGDRITYTSYKNGNPDLYMFDFSKNRETILAKHSGPNLTASWSPDGKTVAYSRIADGNSEIFLLDVRTGEETRLTYMPYSIEISPCFSPTGREIAFTSDRSGTPQIYIMDIMGANVRRLTFEGSYNDDADWSPRGDKICYTSRTSGSFQIAVIDIATGANVYLTSVGNSENPQWSPDGYHIVFTSDRSGVYHIYTMNWDGSNVRRISESGSNTSPAWSPRYRWSFD